MTQPAPPKSYILRELKEVGLPDDISWMPQTLGWQILGLLALIVLIYVAYRVIKHWWLNRYRFEAIDVTKDLAINDPKFEYKLFVIIKRVMGHLYPEHQALYGAEFLTAMTEFPMKTTIQLDESLGNSWMLALTSKQYALKESDKVALKQYCLTWFKEHQLRDVS